MKHKKRIRDDENFSPWKAMRVIALYLWYGILILFAFFCGMWKGESVRHDKELFEPTAYCNADSITETMITPKKDTTLDRIVLYVDSNGVGLMTQRFTDDGDTSRMDTLTIRFLKGDRLVVYNPHAPTRVIRYKWDERKLHR